MQWREVGLVCKCLLTTWPNFFHQHKKKSQLGLTSHLIVQCTKFAKRKENQEYVHVKPSFSVHISSCLILSIHTKQYVKPYANHVRMGGLQSLLIKVLFWQMSYGHDVKRAKIWEKMFKVVQNWRKKCCSFSKRRHLCKHLVFTYLFLPPIKIKHAECIHSNAEEKAQWQTLILVLIIACNIYCRPSTCHLKSYPIEEKKK